VLAPRIRRYARRSPLLNPSSELIAWNPHGASDANHRDLLAGYQFIHLGSPDSQQALHLPAVQEERLIRRWRPGRLIGGI
jgi:hypothetical protein